LKWWAFIESEFIHITPRFCHTERLLASIIISKEWMKRFFSLLIFRSSHIRHSTQQKKEKGKMKRTDEEDREKDRWRGQMKRTEKRRKMKGEDEIRKEKRWIMNDEEKRWKIKNENKE
jgi:hypothetical protein